MTQDSAPQDKRHGTVDNAGGKPDHAPLVWMDWPFRPTPGQTVGFGVVFLVATVVYVVILALHWPGYLQWQFAVVIAGFGLAGGWLLWAGLRRLAWRRRHPGEDPLDHEHPRWGSAYGPATTSAAVVRLVVLVVAWAAALFGAALTIGAVVTLGDGSQPIGVKVVALILVAGFTAATAAIGWYDLKRIRQLRAARR